MEHNVTFILNVLHHDYSLLAADTQANSEGPTTITVGSMTINAANGATVNGFRKMKTSKCGGVAIGVAGTLADHTYFDKFESNEDVDCSIKAILTSIRDFFLSEQRDQNLSKPLMMQNEGIATFFDAKASRYFSLLYIYTHKQAFSGWSKVESGSATLLHVGTGSPVFEKAVGLDEINHFIAYIKCNPDPRACLDWIRTAFEKVSLIAKGVGKEPAFLLSTCSEQAFRVFE
jgi:hypothetical protein